MGYMLYKSGVHIRNVKVPHTGGALARMLRKVFVNFNLEDKIMSITLDNASNNTSAIGKLKLKYESPMDGRFYHSRCVAHIINLVVQDGLAVPAINAIKESFKTMLKDVFKSGGRNHQRYIKICAEAGKPCLSPNWDVPTGWNSTYHMFQCGLKQRSTLTYFHDLLASKGRCDHFPAENWVTIESLTQLLEVFNNATKILSGVYYPTSPLDHLDAQERKQDKSCLENPVDFEEEILDAEVQQNEAIPLSDEEIALDAASSEGTIFMFKMVTLVVDLYHDGCFVGYPLRLVLDKPLSFFYVIPGVPMNLGLRPISNDDHLNDFVQALFENDCHLDMYTEHQLYDVLEMINDDRLSKDKSDSDFEDVEKNDNLDDVKDIVDFQTEGEIEDPIPGLSGRFFVEQNNPDDNFVEPKYKLWYMQNDTYKLLVKYGRDVSADKNKGKVSEGSSDKDKGKVGEGSSNKDKGNFGEGSSNNGKGKLGEESSEPTGWLDGWRKVISLDGCFLTHTCKGQLLTTMGRDANNQMFPIAWVVVGVESKNNWTWFLSLLFDDLNLNDGLTVISDGHKGLIEAVKIWLSDAKHRECTRHIYANFKKK
ncbi:zinc finger BED domain-containing protein RICESLEEPER 2-like protein [Tanacetum coccineum]